MLNITVEGRELKNIIEKVSAAMSKTAFGVVVLRAKGGKLSASVANTKTWLEVNTNHITSLSDGKIAIDKEDIKVITRMTGDVNIIEADKNIIIKNGNKTVTLNKNSLTDYPKMEAEKSKEKLKYEESKLLDTLNNLSVFCTDDEFNSMMQVINFNLAESRIEALDGHRIGLKRIENEEILCNDGNIMVNISAVKNLKKTLDKKSNDIVTIAEGEKYIVITGKNFKYYQRKIAGEYFRVSQMLNNDFGFSFNADTIEALEHFKYYTDNVISKADHKPIMLKIGGDKVISYGKNSRFEASDEMEIKDFRGKELTIGFNPYFIVDALKIADADNVKISGNNSKVPVYIEADKYSFVILPMNIQADEMENYLSKVNAT